jgi:hypothetical protein
MLFFPEVFKIAETVCVAEDILKVFCFKSDKWK